MLVNLSHVFVKIHFKFMYPETCCISASNDSYFVNLTPTLYQTFDVDAKALLQQLPNEESIQQVFYSLTEAKEFAAFDLQKNVFKNYNDFVTISKEISKLENEMLYLRGHLTEMRELQENFRMAAAEGLFWLCTLKSSNH